MALVKTLTLLPRAGRHQVYMVNIKQGGAEVFVLSPYLVVGTQLMYTTFEIGKLYSSPYEDKQP